MKITTRAVFQMTDDPEEYLLLEEDSYDYEGPVAETKGGGDTTTVQSADPWAGAQPYMSDYMAMLGGARNPTTGQLIPGSGGIAHTPQQYYPASTVSPMSQYSQQGIQAMFGRGAMGSPYTRMGGQQLGDVLQGEYLPGGGKSAYSAYDPTEAVSAITAPTLNRISNDLKSQFTASGRDYSGTFGDAFGRAASEVVGGVGASLADAERAREMDYINRERGYQMNASQLMPSYAAQDYTDISAMMQAGGALDQYNQRMRDSDVGRWNFYQNEPWDRVSRYASLVNPGAGVGGTTRSTVDQPSGSNIAGAMGGAAMGGGLLSMMNAASVANPIFWPVLGGSALLGSGLLG